MLPAAANVIRDIGPVLQRLCAAKHQVAFTPFVLETWCAALSVYEQRVVTRAALELALGADPFPDLGKLMMRCQQIVWQESDSVAPGRDESRLPKSSIQKVANAMGLKI